MPPGNGGRAWISSAASIGPALAGEPARDPDAGGEVAVAPGLAYVDYCHLLAHSELHRYAASQLIDKGERTRWGRSRTSSTRTGWRGLCSTADKLDLLLLLLLLLTIRHLAASCFPITCRRQARPRLLTGHTGRQGGGGTAGLDRRPRGFLLLLLPRLLGFARLGQVGRARSLQRLALLQSFRLLMLSRGGQVPLGGGLCTFGVLLMARGILGARFVVVLLVVLVVFVGLFLIRVVLALVQLFVSTGPE